jgi:hypothetical protein
MGLIDSEYMFNEHRQSMLSIDLRKPWFSVEISPPITRGTRKGQHRVSLVNGCEIDLLRWIEKTQVSLMRTNPGRQFPYADYIPLQASYVKELFSNREKYGEIDSVIIFDQLDRVVFEPIPPNLANFIHQKIPPSPLRRTSIESTARDFHEVERELIQWRKELHCTLSPNQIQNGVNADDLCERAVKDYLLGHFESKSHALNIDIKQSNKSDVFERLYGIRTGETILSVTPKPGLSGIVHLLGEGFVEEIEVKLKNDFPMLPEICRSVLIEPAKSALNLGKLSILLCAQHYTLASALK